MTSHQKIEASSLLVSTVKGVGEKLSQNLMKLGIQTVEDLLFHFPIGYQDRTSLKKIAELLPDQEFVIQGFVEKVSQTFVPRKMLLVKVRDKTGHIYLRFFYYFPGLRNVFKEGSEIQVSGTSRLGRYGLETIHPEYEPVQGDFLPQILPKYRLTKGLSHQKMRKIIQSSIDLIKDKNVEISDYMPFNELKPLNEAIINLHLPNPESNIDDFLIGGSSDFRKRVALEEMIANKVSYLSIREQNKSKKTHKFTDKTLAKKISDNLPFELTSDQLKVYGEICQDIGSETPMLRLLQGDVGSGKTIVAALVAASIVADNKQVAILAPTTILANQHYQNFTEWFGETDAVQLLTSKIPVKQKRSIYEKIECGEAKIIIGTHAVFQTDVIYNDLSLVIYDEQHRFGVSQRLKLKEKAENFPHQLLLSATPIPRTMAMGVLSGLDISTIKSLPPNRTPIVTTTLPNSRRDALINRIKNAINDKSQVYWVCPLIDESETELIGIEDLQKILSKEFLASDYQIIHGKMKDSSKQSILKDFKDKKTKILLATTVIEVGIDVPDANIMIIENSERFGLAQLHQLRGRVGRGERESFCILMHTNSLTELSEKRLKIISETNDGFLIAEEDLKLRGPGDILGLSQTGQPSFNFYDLLADENLQKEADRLATEVIKMPIDKQRKIVERWFPAHLELSDV
ncbi:MAG: ATP-dependent DNA helicase RecG [SAR86 cluster bacterium]|uniref:Probable DNA 3'-5' helicase RecG n=1 Tax=SAR86 cluster bacterium TaxID=2030880 RepID=A0A520MWL5_9GAMM|nr:MAG: ATP-dependent DNA helicase RecG [SAR86 cluster bacterium]|tara:strand:- start:1341 stop:3398 length:2058 start_codon:yes stop_codon:yes gene_type:complete